MKNLIKQKQIRGLEERLENVMDLNFVRTTGDLITGLVSVNGNLEASTIEKSGAISSTSERISLGQALESGNLTLNGDTSYQDVSIILNSNKDNQNGDSYPIFSMRTLSGDGAVDIETSFSMNSSDNYPDLGYNGLMIKVGTGCEMAVSDHFANISKYELKTNKPIKTSKSSELSTIDLYIDGSSGLLETVDQSRYIGANYSIFAKTEGGAYFLDAMVSISRNTGLFLSIRDEIGGENCLEIIPQMSGDVVGIYIKNNCFENWRISALSQKISNSGIS